MEARFIVRVLDETYRLLGWAEVMAASRSANRGPVSTFWPADDTAVTMTADGRAAYVAIHWAELDLARLIALDPSPVVATGQTVAVPWAEPIWVVAGGQQNVPLPPVTVSTSVVINVPPARMGAFAGRSRDSG